MIVPDCCSNTYFVDGSGENIPLNLSPEQVIADYPKSELAALLSNEPRFYTSDNIYFVHEIITVGHADKGKPSVIKIDSKSWSYDVFIKKYTNGIIKRRKDGMSLEEASSQIISSLGGLPVTFGFGSLNEYNFVNDDNTIDCEALTHWSGSTGLLSCCQFNAPKPNRFGLNAYPEDKVEEIKTKCESQSLGMNKFLYPPVPANDQSLVVEDPVTYQSLDMVVDGGGNKKRKTNLRKKHKHKKKYKKKNTRRKNTRRKNTRRKNNRRKK